MEDKIPPQDIEAEQAVLGSMLMSKEAIAVAIGKVKPDYFYKQSHTIIFSALLLLYKQNDPIDLVTLANELKKVDKLESVGGRRYLMEIIESVPTASNVEKYAIIVQEKALLRKLIDVGSDIIKESFDTTQELDQVIDYSQKKVLDISKERIQDEFIKIDEVLNTVFDNIQSVYDNDEKIIGVPTGYPDFDAITSGLQPSDLIILAARPAMGKTTFALNLASNVAIQKKMGVAIFSLEMPKEQLGLKLLSAESKLDLNRLKTANLHENEYKSLVSALGTLSESPIYIDDTPGITPMELRAKTRRLQAQQDVSLIIIDYMQLMRSSRKRVESRFQEISDIVREVKGFAKESGIPIIALSQLSRAVEQRAADDRRPRLSDLRESGEIEQTADIVLFVHRDQYYNPVSDNNVAAADKAEIIIAKHRNGSTGAFNLVFQKNISKFRAYSEELAPPV